MNREIQINVSGVLSPGGPNIDAFPQNLVKTTKYTIVNFLPATIFQQLKNVIHLFFIFNGFLQTIPSISTNSPLASLVPVAWTMSMGIIFELIADIRRWKQDNKTNGQQIERVTKDSKGQLTPNKVKSQQLKVGDVILMNDGQMVPADCLVLSTDDSIGQCYISTSNLDGERNLKPKLAPKMTQNSLTDNEAVTFSCMEPHKDIYKFEANITKAGASQTLDLKQFIPRGSTVKNSDNVYALVVYTATDTKLALNEGKYRSKISAYARILNIFLSINIFIMFTALVMMSQIGNRTFNKKYGANMYYVFDPKHEEQDFEFYTFKAMMSFYLLFNGLLPLDLAVTLMITKLFMVGLIVADAYMVDIERSCLDGERVGCQVKNLTLLEDLSRITHLFCDKTGTLTKNELVFRSLAIGQNRYDMVDQTQDGQA